MYSSDNIVKAEQDDLPILEAELSILEEVPTIEFGEESTIKLKFKQSGFNWTKLEKKGFFFAKIYLPIMFNSIIYLLGYNSVVFETEILGNPPGWAAWVNPSSVTYFTGESEEIVYLHVKASRPTSANTVTVRIKYTAYSGGSNVMGTATSDVLVSVKQYHLAEVTALELHKETSPDSIVYFPIEVINRGNYDDTFEFEVSNESNGFLGLVSGQITLKPGETGQVTAMVLTPYVYLFDQGTQVALNVSAYSVYEPSKKFSTAISITSKGILISNMFLLTIAVLALVLISIYLIYHFLIDRQRTKLYGKPNKPWKIPSEEKYLQKLRKKDKKEYNKIKEMMIDEYQSSILWYKDYIKNKKNQKKKEIYKKRSNSIVNTKTLRNFFNNSYNKNKIINKEKKEKENNKNNISKQKIQKNIKKEKTKNKTVELLRNKQKNMNINLKKFFGKINNNKKKIKENNKKPTLKKENQKEKKMNIKNSDNSEKAKEKMIKKIRREEKKQKNRIYR
jgi:hypothetical protein